MPNPESNAMCYTLCTMPFVLYRGGRRGGGGGVGGPGKATAPKKEQNKTIKENNQPQNIN